MKQTSTWLSKNNKFRKLHLRNITIPLLLVLFLGLINLKVDAHPMPNSIVLMDIRSSAVSMELQLPLSELQLAFGHDVATNPKDLVKHIGSEINAYILAHIAIKTADGKPWKLGVQGLRYDSTTQTDAGPYQEIVATLIAIPPAGADVRNFELYYDVIVHQVSTHTILVSIRQDWENGIVSENPVEVGVISLDIINNVIHPLKVNVDKGSTWNGFKSMFALGMKHISEGTDHLMFLLVLLLPAPLLVNRKRWSQFGGAKYSMIRLLKIITAFTIGHSITLLLSAIGWIAAPSKLIEILIGVSILVSALHAIRPLFYGKEVFIAGGFGLVHGMAFASTLANLQLENKQLALSILGFNLGIEVIQMLIMLVTIPWLIILSQIRTYTYVRVIGASIGGIAALAWMLQRYTGKPNSVVSIVERVPDYSLWLMIFLAALAVISFTLNQPKKIDNKL